MRADIDFTENPRDLLRTTIVSFLRYIDTNRASWIVMYTQASSSQAFAHIVRDGREQVIEMVAGLVCAGSRIPRSEIECQMMAVALVGAGEAMATRLSTDDIDVDEAAELMIDLFWHGLRGVPEDREPASALPDVGGPSTLSG